MKYLNQLSKTIHEANVAKGFYEDKKNIPEMLCLIHSEVSEALEAIRKDSFTDKEKFKELFCLQKPEFLIEFKNEVKDTFEDEIADAIIRLLDLCGFLKIDIQNHVEGKLTYNSSRPHKHGKKF